ncbi:hypothetical protein M770_06505 [Pseudomonas aeruginosa VRFPA03]|nr:hypothetical protein M770_06505 [Pseudomonas aeruginosa VRFPA03]
MKFLEKLKKRKERKYFRGWEKIFKAPEKIRLAYPHYEVGVGTYGIPEVTEFGDKATLRIGAYTSIAAGVKILLGGEHHTDWLTTYPFPKMIDESPTSLTAPRPAATWSSVATVGSARTR